mmetsp:Transcript_26975/g.84696  ORF Transcript_26975/g.84696 Transcript_26975/m.84696 type:complete len:286 (-) Transcript_26975:589-1446(-)
MDCSGADARLPVGPHFVEHAEQLLLEPLPVASQIRLDPRYVGFQLVAQCEYLILDGALWSARGHANEPTEVSERDLAGAAVHRGEKPVQDLTRSVVAHREERVPKLALGERARVGRVPPAKHVLQRPVPLVQELANLVGHGLCLVGRAVILYHLVEQHRNDNIDEHDLADEDERDVEERWSDRLRCTHHRRTRNGLRPRLARQHLEERVQSAEEGAEVLLAISEASRSDGGDGDVERAEAVVHLLLGADSTQNVLVVGGVLAVRALHVKQVDSDYRVDAHHDDLD